MNLSPFINSQKSRTRFQHKSKSKVIRQ
uniref:Golgin candidate 5 n=1 Tax=Rhizophora mucronata TaxID=61149 RepID=A0A2P2QPD7_RHIMU